MKNLKLQQYDIALFAGFIFCCVTICYMTWSIREPLYQQDKEFSCVVSQVDRC